MHRAVVGALAWLSLAHFFVVEELVRRGWTLPYSRQDNFLSDLGAVTCGTYKGRQVCSPDHAWINLSFGIVGAGIVLGAVVFHSVLPELVSRPVLALYAAGGVGSALVGVFPEDTIGWLHVLAAGTFFVGANLGHVLLGARLRGRHSRTYGTALMLVGAVGLAGTMLVATDIFFGLGRGSVQRVIVYGADLGFIATALVLLVSWRSVTRTSA